MDQDDQTQNQQGQDQPLYHPQMDEPVQPLAQDDETPFSEPLDVPAGEVPIDHPSTDTSMQPEEIYDEGLSGAVEGIDNTPPSV